MPGDDETPMDEMRDFIRGMIAAGTCSPVEVLEAANEVFEDAIPFADRQTSAYAFVRDALRDHAAAQAGWPDVTDCDRLDAAFAALERSGILARQNYWCCQNCGAAAIWDEVDAAGEAARGYVFYHEQDTEAAVAGHGVYLTYGAVADGDEASVAIGREITVALTAEGLAPRWSGKLRDRIAVPLDWKRRRDDCDWAKEH